MYAVLEQIQRAAAPPLTADYRRCSWTDSRRGFLERAACRCTRRFRQLFARRRLLLLADFWILLQQGPMLPAPECRISTPSKLSPFCLGHEHSLIPFGPERSLIPGYRYLDGMCTVPTLHPVASFWGIQDATIELSGVSGVFLQVATCGWSSCWLAPLTPETFLIFVVGRASPDHGKHRFCAERRV